MLARQALNDSLQHLQSRSRRQKEVHHKQLPPVTPSMQSFLGFACGGRHGKHAYVGQFLKRRNKLASYGGVVFDENGGEVHG